MSILQEKTMKKKVEEIWEDLFHLLLREDLLLFLRGHRNVFCLRIYLPGRTLGEEEELRIWQRRSIRKRLGFRRALPWVL
jgi:hypothetical protein